MKKIFKHLLIISLTIMVWQFSFTFSSAAVLSYIKDLSGITLTLDKGFLQIRICKEDIVEIKYTVLPKFPVKNSLVIDNNWTQKVNYTVIESGKEITISTADLKIKINKTTNAIKFTTLKDVVILSEDQNDGKRMTSATIAGISTYNCETLFNSPKDEALYGLGCHPEDSLSINYKGRNQDLAIKYMTGAIPVLLSNKGYGILWDNYSASKFFGNESNNSKYKYVSESGNMIDYYFFYGPEADHVISLYREATGKAPLFGKWAYGLFQSQDRYKSQNEILTVKDNYRENNIPVDCIVQDWFYWEPNVIGSHVMYKDRYPNPKYMVDELHKANIHAMISIWPVLAKGTRNFDELYKAGCMTDITWDNVMTHTFDSYYDAHSVKAREIYWRQAKDSLIGRYGWDAWWVDQCEPDNGSLLDARRQSNFETGKGIDFFNTYSLMHTTGLYTHWRSEISGKRAFFLVRQAFAGQQRNAATLWSSDITCTFKSLKIQVPQGINACASGIPYWTSDIGGYHYNWSSPDWTSPKNRELFTRWFQFGAFCPIFRIHGKGERALYSDNWDLKTKKILLNYDNLRYRLMPYIYSLAWRVTNEGYTIMRGLNFDFRNDPAVNNIQDQYMFGSAFLVSPVTACLYNVGIDDDNREKVRNVYLPKSTLWYDFWTGKTFAGSQWIKADAPIETIPLFVRAGSIIPMGPYLQFATEKKADTIELRVYTGSDGEFTIYEDENETYNYEKGEHITFTLNWHDASKTLSISDTNGSFPGMLTKRVFNVVLVREQHGTGTGITDQIDKVIKYDGKQLEVKL